jgi:hypothetical protein
VTKSKGRAQPPPLNADSGPWPFPRPGPVFAAAQAPKVYYGFSTLGRAGWVVLRKIMYLKNLTVPGFKLNDNPVALDAGKRSSSAARHVAFLYAFTRRFPTLMSCHDPSRRFQPLRTRATGVVSRKSKGKGD